jgi:Heterokaryon incompatibility protein (HET)
MLTMHSTHAALYSPLPSVNSIRLLRLHSCGCDEPISCSLVVINHYVSGPTYHALSYCWGDSKDTAELICNGISIAVTKTLCSALRRLHKTAESQLIWADAICIDQNNNLERNQQVSIMRQIYHHASRVYIFIGHGDKDSQPALRLIQSIGNGCRMEASGSVPSSDLLLARLQQETDFAHVFREIDFAKSVQLSPTSWKQLWHFYQADWFFRVWVIQEVQSSTYVRLLCGEEEIEWDYVALAANWACYARNTNVKLWKRDYVPSFDGFRNASLMSNQSLRTRREAPFPALLSLVRRFRSTDPRDKVFAILQYPIMQLSGAYQGTITNYPLSSPSNVSLPE